MATKKVHGVLHDPCPEDQAAKMEMRSLPLHGLGHWLPDSGITRTEAARVLVVTQARVSDIKRRTIGSFSFDLPVPARSKGGVGSEVENGRPKPWPR